MCDACWDCYRYETIATIEGFGFYQFHPVWYLRVIKSLIANITDRIAIVVGMSKTIKRLYRSNPCFALVAVSAGGCSRGRTGWLLQSIIYDRMYIERNLTRNVISKHDRDG